VTLTALPNKQIKLFYARNIKQLSSLLKQHGNFLCTGSSKNRVKSRSTKVSQTVYGKKLAYKCGAVQYFLKNESLLRQLYKLRITLTKNLKSKPSLLIQARLAQKHVNNIICSQIIITRKIAFNSLRLIYLKSLQSFLLGTYSGGTSLLIEKAKKTPHTIVDCGLRAGAAAVKARITHIVLRLRSPENVWRLVLKGLLKYVSVNAYYLDKQLAFNGCRGKKS